MNNKVSINTYLSIIEPKKQTKRKRRTETESWIQSWIHDHSDGCQMESGFGKMGEEALGLGSTNW